MALLSACAPAAGQRSASPPATCQWEVADEQRLVLRSGHPAYVEARSISPSEKGILILGSPGYVWPTPYTSAPRVARDSIVGVVLGPDGLATGVPSPVPGAELRGFSAVVNDDASWSVAFVVSRPGTRFPADEVAMDLGFGVFDGDEWRVVETEPVIDGVDLNPMRPSRLVRVAGGLLWALPTRAAEGNAGVAVLRRTGDRWELSVEGPSRASGVSVAHMGMSGAVVAVTRADTTGMAPMGSLRIEAVDREGGGQPPQVDPGDGFFLNPTFDSGRNPRWIGWLADVQDDLGARTEARAARIDPRGGSRTAMVLDSNSIALRPLGPLDADASYWVSHHVDQEGSILLARSAESGPEVVLRMPSPFTGPFGAMAVDSSRILLAGPFMAPDDSSPPVTTLLIDIRRRCLDTS